MIIYFVANDYIFEKLVYSPIRRKEVSGAVLREYSNMSKSNLNFQSDLAIFVIQFPSLGRSSFIVECVHTAPCCIST